MGVDNIYVVLCYPSEAPLIVSGMLYCDVTMACNVSQKYAVECGRNRYVPNRIRPIPVWELPPCADSRDQCVCGASLKHCSVLVYRWEIKGTAQILDSAKSEFYYTYSDFGFPSWNSDFAQRPVTQFRYRICPILESDGFRFGT